MSTHALATPTLLLPPRDGGRTRPGRPADARPDLARAGLQAAVVAAVVNVALVQLAPALGAARLPLLQSPAVILLTLLSVQALTGVAALARRLAARPAVVLALGAALLLLVAGAADLALLAGVPAALAAAPAAGPGAAAAGAASTPLAVAALALMQAVAAGAGLWWLAGRAANRRWDWLVHAVPLAMAATLVPTALALLTGGTVRLEALVKLTGQQAEQLLAACLACTPLVILFGLNAAGRFRKPLGLWAAAFTAVHTVAYLAERQFQLGALTERTYLVLGLIAALILAALAVTSNQWAMRRLGKGWKRLQQLVYLVAVLSVLHIALIHAARLSPLALQYGGLFLILLAVRVSPIRRRLVAGRQQLGRVMRARLAGSTTTRPTVGRAG